MTDPRIALGYEVDLEITGPYTVRRPSPNAAGILDVGIVADRLDGTSIVIGEIWAACVGKDGKKVRIDAFAVATRIVADLNSKWKEE